MNLTPGASLSASPGGINEPSISPDPERSQSDGFWDLEYPGKSSDSLGQ